MNLYLDAPTLADCEAVRQWRNTEDVRATLRTPYMLTTDQQAAFYRDVVCNREARSRWWSVRTEVGLAAFTGLTDIAWETGHAEISLIVSPDMRARGVGGQSVELVLREAFERLRLLCVVAEVYETNPAMEFWRTLAGRFGEPDSVRLPYRKYWNGAPVATQLFHFTADAWRHGARCVTS